MTIYAQAKALGFRNPTTLYNIERTDGIRPYKARELNRLLDEYEMRNPAPPVQGRPRTVIQ